MSKENYEDSHEMQILFFFLLFCFRSLPFCPNPLHCPLVWVDKEEDEY